MLGQLFCKHEYEFINEIPTYQYKDSPLPYKIERVYVCKKCLKSKKVSL